MRYMFALHLQDINVQYFTATRESNLCLSISHALPVFTEDLTIS